MGYAPNPYFAGNGQASSAGHPFFTNDAIVGRSHPPLLVDHLSRGGSGGVPIGYNIDPRVFRGPISRDGGGVTNGYNTDPRGFGGPISRSVGGVPLGYNTDPHGLGDPTSRGVGSVPIGYNTDLRDLGYHAGGYEGHPLGIQGYRDASFNSYHLGMRNVQPPYGYRPLSDGFWGRGQHGANAEYGPRSGGGGFAKPGGGSSAQIGGSVGVDRTGDGHSMSSTTLQEAAEEPAGSDTAEAPGVGGELSRDYTT